MPKSATQLSRSAPLLVAARVVANTSTISHWIHSATAAFASMIARSTLPTVTSINCAQDALAAAACVRTSAVKS